MKERFKPGDTAPVSGLYRVIHPSHDNAGEIVLAEGETFPTCPECRISPSYEFLAALPEAFPIHG